MSRCRSSCAPTPSCWNTSVTRTTSTSTSSRRLGRNTLRCRINSRGACDAYCDRLRDMPRERGGDVAAPGPGRAGPRQQHEPHRDRLRELRRGVRLLHEEDGLQGRVHRQERSRTAAALLHPGQPRHVYRDCARQCESASGPEPLWAARLRSEGLCGCVEAARRHGRRSAGKAARFFCCECNRSGRCEDRNVPVRPRLGARQGDRQLEVVVEISARSRVFGPIVAIAALIGAATLTTAQAPDALAAATRAMGAANLNAIQYSGSGSSFTVGQAPGPGAPWPRFELTKYVASVNYMPPAMREETVRRDVDFPPRGGGAGPFNPAPGQGGMRPIPGDVVHNGVREGRTDAGLVQIWMTPHGFLQGAGAHN